ncbi:MAG: RNA polymerase sigma factor [Candidatus Riflebacteria bacterium]|nr:RNA polymerase sigma factor [Candidatus Riflebacteria bacterium]
MQDLEQYKSLSDDELVLLIRKGRRELFEILFDRHSGRVFAHILSRPVPYEDAKDILQEVFIKAFDSLAGYVSKGKFFCWLLVIARNKAMDYWRAKSRSKTVPDSECAEPSVEMDLSDSRVSEILVSLPEKEREVLLYRFVEDFSYEEIAELTGMTVKSLRNLVSRALRRLSDEN